MNKLPLTISQVRKGLLSKDFSAMELVNNYHERIKKLNSSLNVYLTPTEDIAFSQAKKVDETVRNKGEKAFEENPLLGVTVAHKDLFLTKGVKTTAGSKVLDSYVPAYSATVVERLEKKGAIMLGKLNCDAWAHGSSGENSDFGPTKNPWNEKHVPGGSSSGSAAAVASGLSLFSTGTDTGGSIRLPASFCGVVGFKPTYGAVSRYGVIAMASSLDSVGHFTNSVEDAKQIFNIVKGKDGHDSTVVKPSSNKSHKSMGKKLKIGIPKEYFEKGIQKEVEKSVLEAAKVFEKDGIELVDVTLPNTKYAISVYYIIQPAEVSSNLSRYGSVRYGNTREAFGDEAVRRIMLGTYVLSSGYYDAYYLKAAKVRTKVIEDFDNAFSKVDAIIAPVSPTTAFKLGEKSKDPLEMYLADIYTVAANVAGIPGISIPTGLGNAGLPLGFQLMGPRFSEDSLFELGMRYEKLTDKKPQTANERI